MKITYMFHSGFCVETQDHVLIFDYYQGKIPKFTREKEIHVFVSHKHEDHYNPDVFHLAEKYPNIDFILPNDMKMSQNYMEHKEISLEARDKIIYMKKNDRIQMNETITVTTLRSTDAGVAFLVNAGSHVIYHAGDLNCWVWEGEPEKDQEQMKKAFYSEIDKLQNQSIDVAFLPLDPRLSATYYLGFDYFMKKTHTKLAIPMHFWEQPEVIQRLCEREDAASYCDRICALTVEGESVEVSL